MGQKTIYRGGTIFTMDPSLPRAEAVFVEDGIIKAVGAKSAVNNLVDVNTRIVDLHGGFLAPGLIETHNHLSFYALFLDYCNLGSGACESIDEAIDLLRDHGAQENKSDYIIGYGFDDTYTPAMRHLNKTDLDKVSKKYPVIVFHMSGHVGYLNSLGLQVFGITKDTGDPKGGWIERDEGGHPTGKLDEMAWFQLVGEKLSPPADPATIEALIKRAVKVFNTHGVVAIHDAAIGVAGTGENVFSAYQRLERNEELNIRAFLSAMVESPWKCEPEQIDGIGMGKRRVVVGGVKLFVDGSIQANTAAMLSPYQNKPDTKGELVMNPEDIVDEIQKYHKRGDHISVHANGDAAIEAVISAFENAQKVHYRKDTRHMVIHCQTAHKSHIERMKAVGVIPSFFGMHVYYYGDRHRNIFLGEERAARLNPFGDADRLGLDFTLHTDTPVMPPWTMQSIGTAVTRKTNSGFVLGQDQRISPEKALSAYTSMAAKCSYSENDRGSISIGKIADFTLLSKDITKCDPDTIQNTKVLKTIIEDKTVYEA